MRELIYFVAATLDGFIAREDGSLGDFPMDEGFLAYVLEEFPETFPAHLRAAEDRRPNRWFDSVLMGRKTYEVGLAVGVTHPYPTMDQYLFSRTMKESPDEEVQLVSEDAVGRVEDLKRGTGKAIWLCGGASLATTLLEAGLIDRMIVKLNPVIFGSGIPLFASETEATALELTGTKEFAGGHVILHYRIAK